MSTISKSYASAVSSISKIDEKNEKKDEDEVSSFITLKSKRTPRTEIVFSLPSKDDEEITRKELEALRETEEEKALRKELEELRKANAEIKKNTVLKFQITDRKQLGIMFGTYAARMFKSQWLNVFEDEQNLRKYIKDHESELA